MQEGHSSHSRHIKGRKKIMRLNSARQDGREGLTLTVPSLPFSDIALPPLWKVYAGGHFPVHLSNDT